MTPVEYINHYRVSRAVILLMSSAAYSVEEVGEMTGLSSAAKAVVHSTITITSTMANNLMYFFILKFLPDDSDIGSSLRRFVRG